MHSSGYRRNLPAIRTYGRSKDRPLLFLRSNHSGNLYWYVEVIDEVCLRSHFLTGLFSRLCRIHILTQVGMPAQAGSDDHLCLDEWFTRRVRPIRKKGEGKQIPFAYRLFTPLVANTTSPNMTSTNPSGVIAGTSTGAVVPGTGATNPAVLAESSRSLEAWYVPTVPVA